MSTSSGHTTATHPPWSVLTRNAWSRGEELVTVLVEALDKLDGGDSNRVLYEYIDIEAMEATIARGPHEPGASEIRFDYEGYEIRLTRDGLIAAR